MFLCCHWVLYGNTYTKNVNQLWGTPLSIHMYWCSCPGPWCRSRFWDWVALQCWVSHSPWAPSQTARLSFLSGNLGLGFVGYSGKWDIVLPNVVGWTCCCMPPSFMGSGRRSFVAGVGWRVVGLWEVVGIVVVLVATWFVAHWVRYFVGTIVFAVNMVLCRWFEMLLMTTFARLVVSC